MVLSWQKLAPDGILDSFDLVIVRWVGWWWLHFAQRHFQPRNGTNGWLERLTDVFGWLASIAMAVAMSWVTG